MPLFRADLCFAGQRGSEVQFKVSEKGKSPDSSWHGESKAVYPAVVFLEGSPLSGNQSAELEL